MSRVEVQIMGQGYVLASPDGEEQALIEAAQRVNDAMCSIRDAGKIKARDRIAVLASLNLAFELSQGAAQASPSPSATSQESASQLDDTTAEAALRGLISQLDQALRSDGQLL